MAQRTSGGLEARRSGAKQRLEIQLEKGTKNVKMDKIPDLNPEMVHNGTFEVQLTDADRKKKEKEILVLSQAKQKRVRKLK